MFFCLHFHQSLSRSKMTIELGHSTTFVRGLDQNGQPDVEIGDRLRLVRETSNKHDPNAVMVKRGDRIIGRINKQDAFAHSSLLLAIGNCTPRINVSASVTNVRESFHKHSNGSRHPYTRIDIQVKYSAADVDRNHAAQRLSWLTVRKGINFCSALLTESSGKNNVDDREAESVACVRRRSNGGRETDRASSARAGSTCVMVRPRSMFRKKKPRFTYG